jgi:hypothetical protein
LYYREAKTLPVPTILQNDRGPGEGTPVEQSGNRCGPLKAHEGIVCNAVTVGSILNLLSARDWVGIAGVSRHNSIHNAQEAFAQE